MKLFRFIFADCPFGTDTTIVLMAGKTLLEAFEWVVRIDPTLEDRELVRITPIKSLRSVEAHAADFSVGVFFGDWNDRNGRADVAESLAVAERKFATLGAIRRIRPD